MQRHTFCLSHKSAFCIALMNTCRPLVSCILASGQLVIIKTEASNLFLILASSLPSLVEEKSQIDLLIVYGM